MPAASTSAMGKSAGPSSITSKKRSAPTPPSAEEDLDALFEASIRAYEEAAQADKDKRHFSSTDDIIRLDDGSANTGKRVDDSQRRGVNGKSSVASTSQQGPAAAPDLSDKGKRKAIDVHLDRLQSEKALSEFRGQGKREGQRKARELRAKTAGSDWYDLPAFPTEDRSSSHGAGPSAASSRYTSSARGATAEEMKREVQAIRLRNAMDPKRFYKGGASKDKGLPAFAQLGKIIASPLEPKSYMTKAERGRTVVEELIKDAEAAAYAKRKYGEHQVKAAAGGRGHSKAKTKKPGDRKRQRR
ncbi:Fcf2-domain-containing protein [Microstroma glucosiphilum]|uniref:Fcf2-domain-containing protein n=1 Tax=Pseudomicrostroma glucosiphilum TaxID=1684307 RepID=A0A316UFA3_9BASI|nr:Fcf2-domain-containing protein [Pseudomicrostroma glucosiphilum]PWN23604.1 Fcf2-domain-containing protein [Pseudomicrostroma glucosiphilum]